MASATNAMKRTPLHIASLHGHATVANLMLEMHPCAAEMVDRNNASALVLACSRGHAKVANLFLTLPVLPPLSMLRSLWLAAASQGHAEIVEAMAKAEPAAVSYVDEQGSSALHLAARNSHTKVAKVLLQIDPELCTWQDREGRTPLHLAASKGCEPILEMILSHKLDLASLLTTKEETILHSCIRSKQFKAFKFIIEKFNVHELINSSDSAGNTILHIAAEKKCLEMVEYMLHNTSINTNAVNKTSLTALDIVRRRRRTTRNNTTSNIYNTLTAMGAQSGRQVRREARESNDKEWYLGVHKERPQNVPNIVATFSILIITITYTAVLNPPGGVYQDGKDGKVLGTAIMSNTAQFIVFKAFNDLALFCSLCLIAILIFIRIKHQVPIRLPSSAILTAMWACVAFVAAAYTAASWIISAPGQSNKKMLVAVTLIGWGMLGSVFVWLLLPMMRWQRTANASHGHRTATWTPSTTTTGQTVGNLPSFNSPGTIKRTVEQAGPSGSGVWCAV